MGSLRRLQNYVFESHTSYHKKINIDKYVTNKILPFVNDNN